MGEWYDYWRALNSILGLICVVLLGRKFTEHGDLWNTKTKDYWFALTLWCVVTIGISMEGIYSDSPFGVRLVLVSVAIIVTLKGLVRKGKWGSGED